MSLEKSKQTSDISYVERFESLLRSQGKSAATVSAYCQDLADFFRFLSKSSLKISDVDPMIIRHYKKILDEGKKHHPNSTRRKIIAIRQFFKATFFENEGDSLVAEAIPIPERDDTLQKRFNKVKLKQLLKACHASSNLKFLRDSAIITLFAYEGIKTSELIEIKSSDFLMVRGLGSLRVSGTRQRVITLSPETTKAISEYIQELKKQKIAAELRKKFVYLFIAFKNRDQTSLIPKMSRHGIKFNLYEIGNSVGIKKLSSEVLRNYCIQTKILNGLSIQEVMNHLGLKQPGLIAKHAKITNSRKKNATSSTKSKQYRSSLAQNS